MISYPSDFSMLLLPSHRCRSQLPARVLYPSHPLSQNKKKMRPKIIFVLRSKHRCYLRMRKNNPEKLDMGMRKREYY